MDLREYMKEHLLILDGGMGTLLQAAGLQPGELPERWNLSHPEVITGIQKDYFDAGSNIVLSNTFGANSLKFSAEELESIVSAAVANARRAAELSTGRQQKFVGLDMGPLGRLLRPYGDLDFEEAVRIFASTVRLGVKAGVDLIFIETMNDSYETKAALLAAKENSDLPVFVSNAYGNDGKLMTGATPAAMTAMLEGMHADAIGANCSLGPRQLMGVIEEYLRYASVPVLIKPNAGLPRSEDGRTVYDVYPDEFADTVCEMLKMGVRIAGGCCGTTPEYIKALADRAEGMAPAVPDSVRRSLVSSYTHAVEFGGAPVLIGERINPTGKKRFQQALRDNDIDYILGEGLKQADAGVDLLDVNVGLPEINEAEMLVRVTTELQAVTDLPLQLDTSDPIAMEAALRRYNGKAMINSVNGKAAVMDAIFPLAAKYGGLIVALTLDEQGIPATAEGRLDIARRILARAAEYGIGPEDIIFDPLAMTISADTEAALTTLKAVHEIRYGLGVNTSLGVSNVSFGLPARNIVTSTFFALALGQGLSAAIMNPYAAEMMNVYHAYMALQGLDANCMKYIEYAQSLPQPAVNAAAAGGKTAGAQTAGSTAGGSGPAAGSGSSAGGQAGAAGSGSPTGGQAASGGQAGGSAAGLAAGSAAAGGNAAAAQTGDQAQITPLQNAIMRGLRDKAAALTAEQLGSREPLDLVREEVIPALDRVGRSFEEKTLYLPQLLMAAEAAKAAFEQVKLVLAKVADTEKKGPSRPVVIATVHGDIHDIGKNIVRLLLENYGFDVTDLGKDVPEQTIVDEVVRLHAPMVGLSALMTTTVPAMENTIKLLREQAPWCKAAVGGAVLTQEYADRIGADRYCRDAMDTVRYAEEIFNT